MASNQSKRPIIISESIAEAASWYCAFFLVALILLCSFRDTTHIQEDMITGTQLSEQPCDEIYVVGEGETLHTISDKCGDPFIVEQNPHIHDPDDVFPGLVIRITPPSEPRK
ncbi:uncharacterized protein LOC121248143 [Juglans microcarpa x Juglans regia]|uniref:uncharacterized protein LOC121248143 n=1 Tax=Juglans microcarpa x Juglans regia TaxID=2249226 RepID=UPI001B7F0D8B|nr:uncharacterized protein LOC121248143 [Juglans microcarpa x Juglans regia]